MENTILEKVSKENFDERKLEPILDLEKYGSMNVQFHWEKLLTLKILAI